MNRRVFLDTGIFIALMNRRDRQHPQAAALFAGSPPLWSTSFLIEDLSIGQVWSTDHHLGLTGVEVLPR